MPQHEATLVIALRQKYRSRNDTEKGTRNRRPTQGVSESFMS